MSTEIKKTCIEMLSQRNYKITNTDNDVITSIKPDGRACCLFLGIINQFNVKKYQEYITTAENMDTKHIIVICKKVTANIKKHIQSSANMDIKIETFSDKELKFNITKHVLVPKHDQLTPEEHTEFKKKYNPKIFPVLLKTDAVCRFYNFPLNSFVKIIHRDGGVSYRYVQ